jgi:hypothetical protein
MSFSTTDLSVAEIINPRGAPWLFTILLSRSAHDGAIASGEAS